MYMAVLTVVLHQQQLKEYNKLFHSWAKYREGIAGAYRGGFIAELLQLGDSDIYLQWR